MKNNFLIKQYISDKRMKIKHNYLSEQFKNSKKIFNYIKNTVEFNDFTLGRYVELFEKEFCKYQKSKYAIGVGSGTDAIFLSLKALGIGKGDEVITPTYSFYATAGAIATSGAKPVFVDIKDDLNIDENKIEKRITKKTKAIVPVHFTGYMTNMPKLKKISKKYNLPIVEDACQSILASINNKNSGTWSDFGAFSLHPLKNINVWSDGGIIVTSNKKYYEHLKLLRNHGLSDRDNVKICGYNSRLDTLQAVVGNWLIPSAKKIANQRIKNANFYDKKLSKIKGIKIPPRLKNYKIVYHLYIVFAERRDELLNFCKKKGIEAKIHYPIPMYRQEAMKFLKHKKGDFPVSDKHANSIISFPCDQHLSAKEMSYIVNCVKKFYS